MPNTRAGGWAAPAAGIPRQRSAADRFASTDDSGNAYAGFHTYAAQDDQDEDSGGQDGRWPDNWPDPEPGEPGPISYRDGPPPEPGEDEDGEEPPAARDYWAPLSWTAVWIAAPLLLLLVRALTLSDTPRGCGSGGLCSSPRAVALGALVASAPHWAMALFGGLVVAVVLRWASDAWRAGTIGFCSAVVAGGAATIVFSVSG